jgi:hypothetical protein
MNGFIGFSANVSDAAAIDSEIVMEIELVSWSPLFVCATSVGATSVVQISIII